jgi:glycogen synthase
MNIAFWSNEYPPNVRAGLGRYAERVVDRLVRQGHHVVVLTANPGRLPPTEGRPPLRVLRPSRGWMRALLGSARLRRRRGLDIAIIALNVLLSSLDGFRLLRRLRREIDVVAFHDTTSGPIGPILAALTLRVPVVFHVHSTETTMTPWAVVKDPLRVIAAMERLLGRLADRSVVPSPEQRDLLADHGWRRERIAVVPHGCDPAEPGDPAEARRLLGIPPERPLLVFVGRLVAVKGVHALIRAMPEVVRAEPGALLVLVGEGKGARDAAVDGLVRGLGLGEHVLVHHRFLPSADVARHMLAADLCVFPSLYEPFGLVAVEAMALGRPVLLGHGFSRMFAGDHPDDPAAAFVDASDPGRIAAAAVALLRDPGRRRRLGAAARRFARATFSWDETARRTVALYQEVLDERSDRPHR